MSARESRPVEDGAAPEESGGSEPKSTGSAPDGKSSRAPKGAPTPKATGETQNAILARVTETYLSGIDRQDPPSPSEIEANLLAMTNFHLGAENALRKGNNKLPLLKTLTHTQVADVMLTVDHVVKIETGGARVGRMALLATYCSEGDNEGLYVADEDVLASSIRRYNRGANLSFVNEVTALLRAGAPWRSVSDDRDLIAVGNGIFNFATKELLPYTPDHVFLSKTPVHYDPSAVSPVITTPHGDTWEVEEWMATLSDHPEVVQLLWEVTSAVIRPGVSWNKAAFPFSDRGNNGKGSWVALQEGLCGEGRSVSLPLSEMGEDFMLEPLTGGVSAILTHENDVGTYVDKAANLKAIITNDRVMVNRKGLTPVSFEFRGFMVQCLNELPRVKDKSDSFYRRLLFIPFTKWFGGEDEHGNPIERKYIQDDYVKRPDVLRYVLKRVLHMDHYDLSEPEPVRAALDRYKEYNDSVREWWLECSPRFIWDLLPMPFLYDLYRGWLATNIPDSRPMSRSRLAAELLRLVHERGGWEHPEAEKTRTGSKMDGFEPMVEQYQLTRWVQTDGKTGRPNWTRPVTPAINHRWCLVRTGPSTLAQNAKLDLRTKEAAYATEVDEVAEEMVKRGLDPAAARVHAEHADQGGWACGISTCSVCGTANSYSTDHLLRPVRAAGKAVREAMAHLKDLEEE